MFTTEINQADNGFQYVLKMTYCVWGTDETKNLEYVVNQRKNAYQHFITHACDFLRWTSDYLYQNLQMIRPHYFDRTVSPYFGSAHQVWLTKYWMFLECRDRVRRYQFSDYELARSYKGKILDDLIPMYHFDNRPEIKACVAIIEKLSAEILAAIKKVNSESSLPIL